MTVGDKSALFIGPQGEQGEVFAALWSHLLKVTMQRRAQRFADDPEWQPISVETHNSDHEAVQSALEQLLGLLREEIPTLSLIHI